jgi:hypothetical protein
MKKRLRRKEEEDGEGTLVEEWVHDDEKVSFFKVRGREGRGREGGRAGERAGGGGDRHDQRG